MTTPAAAILRGRIWLCLQAAGLDDAEYAVVARIVDRLDADVLVVLAACSAAEIVAAVLGHQSART